MDRWPEGFGSRRFRSVRSATIYGGKGRFLISSDCPSETVLPYVKKFHSRIKMGAEDPFRFLPKIPYFGAINKLTTNNKACARTIQPLVDASV